MSLLPRAFAPKYGASAPRQDIIRKCSVYYVVEDIGGIPRPCTCSNLAFEKGFLSFAAGESGKRSLQPIAAKVRKPCSELNRGLMPGL
jgi:hypothetical protein